MVFLKQNTGVSVWGNLKKAAKTFVKNTFETSNEKGSSLDSGNLETKNQDKLDNPITNSGKSWEDEWLKNKDLNNPKISETIGGNSPLDISKTLKDNDQVALNKARATLNSQFTHASRDSEYGKKLASEYQEKNTPIYDKLWKEKEDQEKKEKEARAKQQSVAAPSGKTGRGTALGGKRKKVTNSQLENNSETRASSGK